MQSLLPHDATPLAAFMRSSPTAVEPAVGAELALVVAAAVRAAGPDYARCGSRQLRFSPGPDGWPGSPDRAGLPVHNATRRRALRSRAKDFGLVQRKVALPAPHLDRSETRFISSSPQDLNRQARQTGQLRLEPPKPVPGFADVPRCERRSGLIPNMATPVGCGKGRRCGEATAWVVDCQAVSGAGCG
jgi:hypothetical protein